MIEDANAKKEAFVRLPPEKTTELQHYKRPALDTIINLHDFEKVASMSWTKRHGPSTARPPPIALQGTQTMPCLTESGGGLESYETCVM